MLHRPFIPFMNPSAAPAPPVGDEWQHEIKFDGFRVQVHLNGGDGARLFSRHGHDVTRSFSRALMPLRSLSHRHAIIDAELVACDDSGQPCFRTLMRERGKAATLCLWAFDLMANSNKLLIGWTLKRRRSALAQLIAEVDSEHVQFSIDFEDGDALLASAERMGLEGIVSKRRKSPYRAHHMGDWRKIKTASWRVANKTRGEMFRPMKRTA